MRRAFRGILSLLNIRTGLLLATALVAASGLAADGPIDLPPRGDRWNEIRTAHFTLYGNATEAKTREVGLEMERLHAVLAALKRGTGTSSPIPTFIYVFKSHSAMEPYLPRAKDGRPADAGSYFFGAYDGNYVELTAAWNSDPRESVYHNYIYYFMDANFPTQPVWYEVGVAEYYSTVRTDSDEVRTGMIREDLLETLRDTMMIPLDRLLAADRTSPEYNDEIKRDVFFAESWALVHYLTLGNPNRTPQLGRYLILRQKGRPQDEAFREAFQTDYAVLFGELVAYVRNKRFLYNRHKVSELAFSTEARATPMSYESVVCRLGDLLVRARRFPDAERYYQAVLATQPANADAIGGLGLMRLRQERRDEAAPYLRRAAEAGSTDFRVYYESGRLLWDQFARQTHSSEELEKNRPLLEEARADLRKSIERNPEFPEAQAALGRTFLSERGPAVEEGIAALETARKKLPSREDVVADLAALYDRKGEKARGDAILKSAGGAGAAEELAKRGGRSQLEASLQQVNDLLEAGKDDEALALFDGMIAKSSGEIRTELESQRASLTKAIARNRAVKEYNAAISLYNKRDVAGALAAFQKLAEASPDSDIAAAAREKVAELSRQVSKKAPKP